MSQARRTADKDQVLHFLSGSGTAPGIARIFGRPNPVGSFFSSANHASTRQFNCKPDDQRRPMQTGLNEFIDKGESTLSVGYGFQFASKRSSNNPELAHEHRA
jgi:hypothetical protein